MAQPSVLQYFKSRKRPATNDFKTSLEPSSKLAKLSDQPIKQIVENPLKNSECEKPKIETKKNPQKESSELKPEVRKEDSLQKVPVKEMVAPSTPKIVEAEKTKAEKQPTVPSTPPKLKTFGAIEFEVLHSPKTDSPEKPYLSPKKDSTVRRNLWKVSSCKLNTEKDIDTLVESPLQLPLKYKSLSETFRAMETVCQILYQRKETITFNMLKSSVEKILKRTFTQKHLAQIKSIYPDAYEYTLQKVKSFAGNAEDKKDLVLTPKIDKEEMTTQVLLERRRQLNRLLIDKVKEYHNEFLLSLTPPVIVSKDKLTRWHPEFNLEKIPDIELAQLPEAPTEKPISGRELLQNMRQLISSNSRMQQALLKLKDSKEEAIPTPETSQPTSALKGIPKALLEKVRQKQAAKALISMTRSADKEKELLTYRKLPEIARLTRSLFVAEKKSVLELGFVVDKLGNSIHGITNKEELEESLKIISKEVPGWLVFHNLRKSMFVKLNKNANLNEVVTKLENLAKEKSES